MCDHIIPRELIQKATDLSQLPEDVRLVGEDLSENGIQVIYWKRDSGRWCVVVPGPCETVFVAYEEQT